MSEEVKAAAEGIVETVTDIVPDVVEAAKEATSEVTEAAAAAASQAVEATVEAAAETVEAATGAATEAVEAASAAAVEAIDTTAKTITAELTNVTEQISEGSSELSIFGIKVNTKTLLLTVALVAGAVAAKNYLDKKEVKK